jgi:DNA-binding NarL/FixJ family response regulator
VPCRILIADDNAAVRQAIREMLHQYPGWQVVGEAGDGMAAVKRTHELHPDMLIIDVRMPRLDGLQATKQIMACAPNTTVIALSTFADVTVRREMEEAGCSAFIRKEDIVDLPHVIERLLSCRTDLTR